MAPVSQPLASRLRLSAFTSCIITREPSLRWNSSDHSTENYLELVLLENQNHGKGEDILKTKTKYRTQGTNLPHGLIFAS